MFSKCCSVAFAFLLAFSSGRQFFLGFSCCFFSKTRSGRRANIVSLASKRFQLVYVALLNWDQHGLFWNQLKDLEYKLIGSMLGPGSLEMFAVMVAFGKTAAVKVPSSAKVDSAADIDFSVEHAADLIDAGNSGNGRLAGSHGESLLERASQGQSPRLYKQPCGLLHYNETAL